MMTEILSLWRSPLDKVAMSEAEALRDRQPHCSIVFNEDFHLMTVYNYGFYYDAASMNADTALTNMFNDMSPNYLLNNGGTAFIPQQSFTVHANSYPVPDQCNITGSGGGGIHGSTGTDFFHFVISDPAVGGPFIFLNCTGNHTCGGKYFRGLAFKWSNPRFATDTCIFTTTWNTRAINCTFDNCPLVFDGEGEGAALEQCTINYGVSGVTGPNSTIAVIIKAPQCAVIGPSEFSQTSQFSGGPSGCTCIAIKGPAEHTMIADMRIYEWNIGIDWSQHEGSQYAHITNCEIICWRNALNVQLPSGASGITAGIKVTGCTLAKASDSSDAHSIVYVDANGAMNTQLNDIALVDCTVFNMHANPSTSQHGLEIKSGSNVRVIGGTYSNNGGAGIAITGLCDDVQIIGVNLQPSYPPAAPNVNTQQYALLVSAAPATPVLVSNCDMSGYGSGGPVSVSGTQTKLTITNCPGYNDQSTSLNHGVAPTGTALSAATCTTPYFGPSVITWSSSTSVTVHVFGLSYTAFSGIIFLPSPYDGFYCSITPTISFSWTGK